jgi:CarboxypepD_reg-like domain
MIRSAKSRISHSGLFFLIAVILLSLRVDAAVVKGTVRDTLGEPIPYMVVMVKNTSYGVNTNLDGTYFLELKPGNYTLVFSQLGYQTQEHAVTATSGKTVVLNITMQSSAKELGAVVITGKGDRDKGKEIMKKVIARRDNYWDKVDNYSCRTYQKSSLEKQKLKKPFEDTLYAKEEP